MDLNAEQEAAVDMARKAANTKTVAVLAGPAGTGKTTSLRAICSALPDSTIIAPTNRAAVRAQKLSGNAASTIHSWLYKPMESPRGVEFRRRPIAEVPMPPSGLIIVDESSMIGPDIWRDIFEVLQFHDCGALLVGDPFQLPPVSNDDDEFSVFDGMFRENIERAGWTFKRTDLIHVWRQAQESPIIRAATELRRYPKDWQNTLAILENRPSKDCADRYGYDFAHPRNIPARVLGLIESGIDHCVIAYTNDCRNSINKDVRKMRGFEGAEPQPGEPILIRRNSKIGVSNGEVVKCEGVTKDLSYGFPPSWRTTTVNGSKVIISLDMMDGGAAPKANETRGLPFPFLETNYGYAMTCHHAQGSEFDWVIVNWESVLMRVYSYPVMRARWMYTAFTRSKTKLMIGGL